MTEHAIYFEKADHCTFPLFEKQQIIIVASEMEKVIICINDFLFHLSGLVFHQTWVEKVSFYLEEGGRWMMKCVSKDSLDHNNKG